MQSPKRNPGITKKEAENILSKYLGVENFIWLIAALEFDDTGGHIDNLACFTPSNQILVLSETDPEDSNYERLKENLNLNFTIAAEDMNHLSVSNKAQSLAWQEKFDPLDVD